MTAICQRAARRASGVGPALATLAFVLWAALGPASAAVSDATVDALAGEILRGLDAADVDAVPAGSGYEQPTIAIKAFTEAPGPVGAAEANFVNDRLLMALQRRAGGRFRFVARDAVGDLIADMGAAGLPEAEREARLADLQANLRADILIRGTVRETARGAMLTYQAVATETGALFVTTTPVSMTARPPLRVATPVQLPGERTAGGGLPDSHPTVLEAERLLAELGYDPGPVDGILTEQTRAALRDYQRDSALPINGRMTWNVVENMRRDTR